MRNIFWRVYIYFIDRLLKIRWSSGYRVGPLFSRRVGEMVQILTGAVHMKICFIELKVFHVKSFFFASGKIYKQLVLRLLLDCFHFIDIPI